MILRILNLVVIGALVLAAAYVYRIKYEATAQAEYLAKLRNQVRQERDKIADLRARWGELDDPARIQDLAKRFLKLQSVEPTQFDSLDHLPDQPPEWMRPGSKDPIGGMIEHLEVPLEVTGSVPPGNAASPPPAGTDVAAPQGRDETTAPPAAAPAQSGAGSE